MKGDSQLKRLFGRYHGKSLFLDANLLLVYLVGCVSENLVGRHSRTSNFTSDDFVLLAQIIHRFQNDGRILTTPHILTEVSNLLNPRTPGGFYGDYLERSIALLAAHIADASLEEEFVPARELVMRSCFRRFGLTDSAIAHLAPRKALVISDDGGFVRGFLAMKLDAIWFRDLRQECLG